MANWFYYDMDGIKQGPIDGEKLKTLAEHGIIKPDTLIETESGKTATADKIKGLAFKSETSIHSRESTAISDGSVIETKVVKVPVWAMSTPPCPDCGKPVSREAVACVYCGRKILPPKTLPFFVSLIIPGLGHYIQGRSKAGSVFLSIAVVIVAFATFLASFADTEQESLTVMFGFWVLLVEPIALLAAINCAVYKPK